MILIFRLRQEGTRGLNVVTCELQEGKGIVGRGNVQLKLEDKQCSRTHALIYVDEKGQLFMRDLGSKNGLFLSGSKVSEFRLRVGATVNIGGTCLELLDVAERQ